MSIFHIISTIFIFCGMLFFTGGAVGILRFPDFYSRLHPAGKLDTMGLFMSMTGMALYTIEGFTLYSLLTSLKMMLIVVLVFITSPTATHAIVDAGVRAGLSPWEKEEPAKEEISVTYVDIVKDLEPGRWKGRSEE